EDGIRDFHVTGVQTCALPICEWWVTDPYSFGPVLGPMDDYYIAEGSHLRLFDKLGAHLIDHEGASGVHFAVWAPNAKRVSVVGRSEERRVGNESRQRGTQEER